MSTTMCLVLSVPYLTRMKTQLNQISLVNKRLRGISLPLLLQRVSMIFVYRKNLWKVATDAIESRLASTALDVVSRETRSNDSMPSVLPGRLAELLLTPFRQLPRTLVFVFEKTQAQAFEDESGTAGIELTTVTTLVSPYFEFVVPLCPNVEYVACHGWSWLHSQRGAYSREHSYRLIAAAGRPKMLQHFEMGERWSVDLLKDG
ncbi:hypothetical protein EDD18DRAFT_1333481 [Armillaria luteobubalina]|uniref:Uncharacterized protein n=1 Tax=Armillaria luteobubalina TaxID=153913 RepID=A0AA39TLP0_9AGAR|nr:hypothetical protein EDD18DRAFT_1333481 [Armillaria luteobubalina]